MNGTFGLTADGFEQTVGVNCVGTAALTLALLPLMHPGSRIVNTLSCTYRIGRVDDRLLEPDPERYARFRAYGTSKLALLLFSLELRERVARQGIGVFAADPGIVDTNMITMHRWFDPIADLLFRPLIKTPEQGAETALQLACGKRKRPLLAERQGTPDFGFGRESPLSETSLETDFATDDTSDSRNRNLFSIFKILKSIEYDSFIAMDVGANDRGRLDAQRKNRGKTDRPVPHVGRRSH